MKTLERNSWEDGHCVPQALKKAPKDQKRPNAAVVRHKQAARTSNFSSFLAPFTRPPLLIISFGGLWA